jgi:hypothetical protein
MKLLLAGLLALLAGCSSLTPKHPVSLVDVFAAAWRAEAINHGHDPDSWVIKDTGEVIDLGEGEGPIVEIYKKEKDFACLQAVAPDGVRSATLTCYPREPELGS